MFLRDDTRKAVLKHTYISGPSPANFRFREIARHVLCHDVVQVCLRTRTCPSFIVHCIVHCIHIMRLHALTIVLSSRALVVKSPPPKKSARP